MSSDVSAVNTASVKEESKRFSPTPFTTNKWTLVMLPNYPIIFVSGSHYCMKKKKKERRQKFSPHHKHSNLSSREIVGVRSQLPSTPLRTSSLSTVVPNSLYTSDSVLTSEYSNQATSLTTEEHGFDHRYENTAFFSEKQPVRLWDPLSLQFSSYMGLYDCKKNGRGAKLTTGHYLAPRLRKSRAILLLPHIVVLTPLKTKGICVI
jgi:hypothetical protein